VLTLAHFVLVSIYLGMDLIVLLIDRGGELAGDLDRLLLLELEGILRTFSEELQCL